MDNFILSSRLPTQTGGNKKVVIYINFHPFFAIPPKKKAAQKIRNETPGVHHHLRGGIQSSAAGQGVDGSQRTIFGDREGSGEKSGILRSENGWGERYHPFPWDGGIWASGIISQGHKVGHLLGISQNG